MLARASGVNTVTQYAEFGWQLIKAQGQVITKEGTVLRTEEENLAEMTTEANNFVTNWEPVYTALQLC